jgi:DNA-binding transcriptional regulator YdaS (Cro superfamily)
MKLAHYLRTHRLTQEQFAARIGQRRASVSHWVTGRAIPRASSMGAIYRATEGAVTPDDFWREQRPQRKAC